MRSRLPVLRNTLLVLTVAAATCLGVTRVLGGTGTPGLVPQEGVLLLGHALGGVHGKTYTNSREAFDQSMRDGRMVLEADLQFASDGVVMAHDDNLANQMGIDKAVGSMTTEEFLRGKVYAEFTPLSLGQMLDLLEQHPDVTLVTDTKDDAGRMFESIVTEAARRGPGLLDRIVPQIYAPADLEHLNAVHRFPRVIFTLYRTNMDDAAVLAFVRANPQVSAVTMSGQRFSDALARDVRALGRDVFVHTINDPATAGAYLKRGADGIYTDFLLPRDLPHG